MKSNILLATICLGLGAAIAWIAKPDTPDPVAENDPVEKSPKVPASGSEGSDQKREVSERKAVTSNREPGAPLEAEVVPENSERANQIQEQMASMFKKRRMAKIDARISKLVSQLNLTPEQEEALRKAAEERLDGLQGIFNGEGDRSQIADIMKGDGIDEALGEILTPEQKEEHEVVKKRELANKVEASALKELAKLSSLDMTQEQKDKAYDILYKQAESTVTNEPEASGMVSVITEGIGIELDSDSMGFATAMIPSAEDLESGEFNQGDPQEMMARARENMNKKIDEKVEALRPVLNDSQLEQYRKNLEIKSGGLFGGMLGGFGTFKETGGETE